MKKIIIASGPVIIENNKVLLDIQGKDDFWKFCGGKIHDGETLAETAFRRAKEELGIDIKILNDKPYVCLTRKQIDENIIEIILVHFLAERTGEIKPGTDVKEWQWHDIKTLPSNLGENIIPALKYFGYIK